MSACRYCQLATRESKGDVFCSLHSGTADKLQTGVFRIGAGEIHSSPHRSRFAFRFVYAGNAILNLDGRSLRIHKPCLIQFNQDASYQLDIPVTAGNSLQLGIAFKPAELRKMLALIFLDNRQLLDDPDHELSLPGLVPFERIISPAWQQIATRIERLIAGKNNKDPENGITELATDALKLFYPQRGCANSGKELGVIKKSTREELLYRVSVGRDYLENCANGQADVQLAAGVACLSVYHFIRTFRAVFGYSPYQYVLRKKFKIAYRQISETDLPVSEVAAETGYSDYSVFSRKFRQEFGLSPGKLRSGFISTVS